MCELCMCVMNEYMFVSVGKRDGLDGRVVSVCVCEYTSYIV
jgi:hypothetical protein